MSPLTINKLSQNASKRDHGIEQAEFSGKSLRAGKEFSENTAQLSAPFEHFP